MYLLKKNAIIRERERVNTLWSICRQKRNCKPRKSVTCNKVAQNWCTKYTYFVILLIHRLLSSLLCRIMLIRFPRHIFLQIPPQCTSPLKRASIYGKKLFKDSHHHYPIISSPFSKKALFMDKSGAFCEGAL